MHIVFVSNDVHSGNFVRRRSTGLFRYEHRWRRTQYACTSISPLLAGGDARNFVDNRRGRHGFPWQEGSGPLCETAANAVRHQSLGTARACDDPGFAQPCTTRTVTVFLPQSTDVPTVVLPGSSAP